ncbi:hypothetical protein [Streptomyces sp. NPDC049881]|uniref:hypothetical protein n=1 Tax=Streptomyces sp. NPDC049881 TaxID=3155778 RepID=UPI003443BA27
MLPRHLTAALAVLLAATVVTSCGGGDDDASASAEATPERTTSPPAPAAAPTPDVPLGELTDGEAILARTRAATEAVTSAHLDLRTGVAGMPDASTLSLYVSQDGSCVAHFTNTGDRVVEVLRTQLEVWARMDAGSWSQTGGPPELAGKWLHGAPNGQLEPLTELCRTEPYPPLDAWSPEGAPVTVTPPPTEGGPVEVSWDLSQDGMEAHVTLLVAGDGTDLPLEAGIDLETPTGTMEMAMEWDGFDRPVEVTPPAPGTVVDVDGMGGDFGQLPLPGGGLVP